MRASGPLALAVALVAGGCGAPGPGEPHVLPRSEVPYDLLSPAPEPAPVPSGSPEVAAGPQAYFVDTSGLLVPVSAQVAADPGHGGGSRLDGNGPRRVVARVLARLSAGPDERERARGLASALEPGVELEVLGVDSGTATVEVPPFAQEPTADRLPLVVGQIVLTATSVPGVHTVRLRRDGEVLEVPVPGGARTSALLTAADYAPLTASGTRAVP
ncbi:sporulation and spore germination protein [Kineococcus xinjiangensis]|uniref:Sporulation and spore germination protein n=1 Tax=Kineococcus xinjiangensis TaxID=512762 RepID=A0A2S6IF83_9ACTN|nr:GerMN domain-containing protein [Kineococcus xinjiangensis]PPK92869.1 sporulation and spore germination protein [Kineococcus xinjiangensis]